MSDNSITEVKVNTGPYTFTVKSCGNKENEPVLFLHGFPETSHMWHELQSDLAEKGYFSAAPDQKGYSKEARPKTISDYSYKNLGKDIIEIADEMGIDKFHLVGHDWGSIISWYIAFQYPHRVKSLTALSVPHPLAFADAIRNDKDQKKRSSYMKLFLIPWLPEFQLRRNNFAMLKKIWRSSDQKEIDEYLKVIGSKKAINAILNWYRANYGFLKGKDEDIEMGEVHIPTLFIWGRKDRFIGRSGSEKCGNHVRGIYKFEEIDGGHWLVQTNYDEVLSLILDHISKHK